MPANLKPVAQLDFSGGVNLVVNPYLIGQKQMANASNLILDEHGALRTRDGVFTIDSAPQAGNILLRGVLTKSGGSIEEFAIQRVSGANKFYDTGTDPWTEIIADVTLATAENLPDVTYGVEKALIVNGYETPKTYDGTVLAAVTAQVGQTVPTGAKHAAFHLGHFWLWNTDDTTTSLDGPSSLRSSATNLLNDWPNANQTFISKDDGQVGTGLAAFTIVETGISPTATLVCFKNYSAYQVTGVFGGSTFSVQRIKSDMGCIASRTIQFVSGFGTIRLTHKGFALYNGVEDRLISEEIRPAIFGGRGFTKLDFDTAGLSWAIQSQNPPLYIAACPVVGGGGLLSRIFVYDLIRRGWTLATLPTPPTSMALFFTPNVNPVVHIGTAAGKLLRWFDGDTTDDGAKVEWKMKTRFFFAQNPLERSYWRRAQVLAEGDVAQSFDITPVLDGARRATRTRRLPDTPDATTAEDVLTIDIQEKARSCQIEIAGKGAVRIRGVELHASPQPVRPAQHQPL